MIKITLLLSLLFPFTANTFAEEVALTPEAITASQVANVQHSETYIYIRC